MEEEIGFGVAIDADGNALTTGFTSSSDYPTVNALQPNLAGELDAFIARFDPSGAALFSTYLGGTKIDEGIAVAVDRSGNTFVTGFTRSPNFPLASGLQLNLGGSDDCFVTKISPTGSAIIYSTYLGGSGSDLGRGIAVDSAGTVYVTGGTASPDFRTTPGALQPVKSGGNDAFVTKIAAFDMCVQDDSNGRVLLVNSTTGAYQYTDCRGVTLEGTGAVIRRGCLITIQSNAPDHRVLAKIDTCLKSGTASIQFLRQGTTVSIVDRTITNNTCRCSG
jgi:hypothetical protein